VDFWAHVERLSKALAETSYFELLNIEPDASVLDLTAAYHRALKRYHPDQHMMSGSNREKEQQLARICARIGEGYRVLSKQSTRLTYIQALNRGEMRPQAKRATLGDRRDPKTEKARVLLTSAKQLIARGASASARAKLELALQFEPSSSTLKATLAELSAPKPPIGVAPSPQESSTKEHSE